MQVVRTIPELKSALAQNHSPLALIPTMGALHEGHLSLVEIAKESAEFVALSIFVNPTQFNNPTDLKNYPRIIDQDLDKLAPTGVDLVFCPNEAEIYQNFQGTKVHPSILEQQMEGPFRPGHFQGVCTIVTILFNLFRPDVAIFGEKDFQQVRIIEDLVSDLKMNINIVRAPIKRETNGLARSSRNELLSPEDRIDAKIIFETLILAKELLSKGENNLASLLAACHQNLSKVPRLKTEYLTINHSHSLEEITDLESEENLRIFFAGYFGNVRLIDNLKL